MRFQRAYPAQVESPVTLYLFVFTQFRTKTGTHFFWNCFNGLLIKVQVHARL
jgi:hypothetical protein